MEKEDVRKKIADIIFNALTQKEEITKEQDKKIKKEIIDALDKNNKGESS